MQIDSLQLIVVGVLGSVMICVYFPKFFPLACNIVLYVCLDMYVCMMIIQVYYSIYYTYMLHYSYTSRLSRIEPFRLDPLTRLCYNGVKHIYV